MTQTTSTRKTSNSNHYLSGDEMGFCSRAKTKVLGASYKVAGTYPSTKTFEERITQHSRFDRPEIMDNFDTGHAAYVMETIYRKAAHECLPILHITGSFLSEVYDQDSIVQALEQCNRKNVPIRYIVTEPNEFAANTSGFAEIVRARIGKNVELKEAHLPDQNHMITLGSDGRVFRFETDTLKHKAKLSFNSPDIGSIYVKQFEELYSQI